MKKRVVIAALGVVGLVLIVTGGCSDDPAETPSADGTFTVETNGTTRDFRMQNGEVYTFVFPASAAGKQITIRPVSDASVGLAGKFPSLLELLPHGTTFSPPVRVIPKAATQGNALVTFASEKTAGELEFLPAAAGADAYELAHFSFFAAIGTSQFCNGGTLTDLQDPNAPCCPGGVEHVYECVFPAPRCLTIKTPPSCHGGGNSQSPCSIIGRVQTIKNSCSPVDGGGASGDGGDGGGPSDSGSDTGGGSKFDAAVGGCPNVGKYSVAASGSCGDLSTTAPNQRIDGTGCLLRFEHDSGGTKGVSSTNQTFAGTGVTQAISVTLGTSAQTCKATCAGGTQVELDCGACVVFMERTGDL